MYLKEYKELENYKDELELCNILELIGDKVNFRGYEEQELLTLVKRILEIDILSLNYTARELVLSVLCDAVSRYDILSKINWSKIIGMKESVEDDLKEYIEDFFE